MKKESQKSLESQVKLEEKTVADLIWDEIKDFKINMFALPDQTVSKFCNPIKVEPTKLYLKLTASAVLPSLEEAISPKFSVERTDYYIIVSHSIKK